jgi:hypothetical protein
MYLDADSGVPSFPYFVDASKGEQSEQGNNLLNFISELIKYEFPGVRCKPAGKEKNGNFLTVVETDMTSAEGRMVWLFTWRISIGLNVPPANVAFRFLEKAYELMGEPLPITYETAGK